MLRRFAPLAVLVPALLAGCSATAPTGKWQKTGAVEVSLEGTWPPRFAATLVTEKGMRSHGSLLLDTGTEDVALDERRVSGLDLSRTWPPRFLVVQGLSVEQGGVGRRMAAERKLPALELPGAVRLEDLRVVPLPMPEGLDGALGLAAFPGRALVLDPVDGRVTFVPSSMVDALLGGEGVVRIPARRDGNLLVATIGLTGKNGATGPLDVVFDTGAQDSFVSPEALEKLPPSLAAASSLAGDGADVEYGLTLGTFSVGPRAMRVDRRNRFCTLGGVILLALGRPVLFDLEGGRLALLAATKTRD